jgi:hypothetical protein
LLGNNVKSLNHFIEFMKLLKEKGMKKEDIEAVKSLITEARILLGIKG